jgi:hypothetical protein
LGRGSNHGLGPFGWLSTSLICLPCPDFNRYRV